MEERWGEEEEEEEEGTDVLSHQECYWRATRPIVSQDLF